MTHRGGPAVDRECKTGEGGSTPPAVTFVAAHKLIAFRNEPLKHLQSAADLADVVMMRFPFRTAYLVTGPEGLRQVLEYNQQNYVNEPRFTRIFRSAIGNGVLTAEGELWRQTRARASAAFHGDRSAYFASIIADSCALAIERWRAAGRRGEAVELEREFIQLTLTIGAKVLCGVDLGERAQELGRAIFDIFASLNARIFSLLDLPQWIPTAQNRQLLRASRTAKSIVGWLIETAKKTGSEQQIPAGIEELIALLGAASATTAAVLVWFFFLLAEHPQAERQVQEEARALGSQCLSNESALHHLNYTRRSVMETLRLYPPAWAISARALHSDLLGKYQIPANAHLVLSPYVTHRLPRVWHSPDRFDPDRFLPGRSATDMTGYFPFGRGPRRCIGERFAMMQMTLIVAMIARTLRLIPLEGQSREPRVAFTLRTSNGLWVRASDA